MHSSPARLAITMSGESSTASSTTPSTAHRPPLQEHSSSTPSLNLTHHKSPHSWFNPTHLYLSPTHGDTPTEWSSRKARKGRYSRKRRHIHDHSACNANDAEQGHAHKSESVYLRIQDVESEIKPHLVMDVSFWVAFAFTFGSAVWVVNGEHSRVTTLTIRLPRLVPLFLPLFGLSNHHLQIGRAHV